MSTPIMRCEASTNPRRQSGLPARRGDLEPFAARRDPGSWQPMSHRRERQLRIRRPPADRKLYRVLDLTYFNPAPKQEAAAARLRLSLSTYRRYLTTGIDRLTEWLWRQEQESAQSETTADHSNVARRRNREDHQRNRTLGRGCQSGNTATGPGRRSRG